MSLVGMDLAFKYAARHADGVLVAPPPVVAILKMVAFADRPAERERDLVDIAHLLDAYVNEEDERRWDETPDGTEFDLAPAYLFGVDLARVLSRDDHRRVVSRFLDQIEATDSPEHLLMLGNGPLRWRTERNAPGARTGAAYRHCQCPATPWATVRSRPGRRGRAPPWARRWCPRCSRATLPRLDDLLEGRGRKPTVELVVGATGRLIDDPKELDRWLDELRQQVLQELEAKHRVQLR